MLISGDKVWIARHMPGKFASNRVHVCRLFGGKLKGRGRVSALIIELARKRVEMNQKLANEIANGTSKKVIESILRADSPY